MAPAIESMEMETMLMREARMPICSFSRWMGGGRHESVAGDKAYSAHDGRAEDGGDFPGFHPHLHILVSDGCFHKSCRSSYSSGSVEYAPTTYWDSTCYSAQLLITLFYRLESKFLSFPFLHTAHGDAMLQVLDGEAAIVINGKGMTACAGEVVVMPANVPHFVTARKRLKMLLILVKQAMPV